MKIVLASGIYPPDIGGPATYVRGLADQLTALGHDVVVVSYGKESAVINEGWKVVTVDRSKNLFVRWRSYANALKEHGMDADVVYAFSSISAGIPLRMAGLKTPRKVLRLGGDFLWERYTDKGGRKGLRSFYVSYPGTRFLMKHVLKSFDAVVFSTAFQQRLSEFLFRGLPQTTVIENAHPADSDAVRHEKHEMLHVLFLGRFVRFKNLPTLLHAIAKLPYASLTLVGEGPEQERLQELIGRLGLMSRAKILPPVGPAERAQVFGAHDLMVIPSVTEISPNAALEARASGLPVLLTEETGLSSELSSGMMLRPLKTVDDVTRAIIEAEKEYAMLSEAAAQPMNVARSYGDIAQETVQFFEGLPSKK